MISHGLTADGFIYLSPPRSRPMAAETARVSCGSTSNAVSPDSTFTVRNCVSNHQETNSQCEEGRLTSTNTTPCSVHNVTSTVLQSCLADWTAVRNGGNLVDGNGKDSDLNGKQTASMSLRQSMNQNSRIFDY